MKWEEDQMKEEIEENQIEENSLVMTIKILWDLKRWLKWKDNRSLAKEVDIEMKETELLKRCWEKNKHAEKELSKEEMNRLVEEIEVCYKSSITLIINLRL